MELGKFWLNEETNKWVRSSRTLLGSLFPKPCRVCNTWSTATHQYGLVAHGCDWMRDYLKNNPKVDESDRLLKTLSTEVVRSHKSKFLQHLRRVDHNITERARFPLLVNVVNSIENCCK